MAHNKPFHRNFRAIVQGPNSGYSGWAYIADPEYAKTPAHYVRAYSLIQNDLQTIFEYVEPSDECLKAFSYRNHSLLMRTCIEVEANFKAILHENIFSSTKKSLNIGDYRAIDVTHHLSSYEVTLPIWNGLPLTLKPFSPWLPMRGKRGDAKGLPWYQAYNASKHDRQDAFKEANLENLLNAVAGLLVLLTSQFKNQSFSAGPDFISTRGDRGNGTEDAIGSLFRIKYPDDWLEDEKYDFNWSILQQQPDRFQKFNYNEVWS